eukprot:m51a1_g1229 hypothetical protein (1448) ;mRNA; f:519865-527601
MSSEQSAANRERSSTGAPEATTVRRSSPTSRLLSPWRRQGSVDSSTAVPPLLAASPSPPVASPRVPPLHVALAPSPQPTRSPPPAPSPRQPGSGLPAELTPRDPFRAAIAELGRRGTALERSQLLQSRFVVQRMPCGALSAEARTACEALALASAETSRSLELALPCPWLAPAYTPEYVAALRAFSEHSRELLAAVSGDAGTEGALASVVSCTARTAALIRGQAAAMSSALACADAESALRGEPPGPEPEGATEAVVGAYRTAESLVEATRPAEGVRSVFEAVEALQSVQPSAELAGLTKQGRTHDGQRRALLRSMAATLTTSAEFGLSAELPVHLLQFTDGIAVLLPQPHGYKYRYKLLDWYDAKKLYVVLMSSKNTAFKMATMVAAEKEKLPPGWKEITMGKNKDKRFAFEPLGLIQQDRPAVPNLKGLRHFVLASAREKAVWIAGLKDATVVESDCAQVPYNMLGISLEDVLEHEDAFVCDQTVPLLVRKVLYQVVSDGLHVQGLLRVSGGVKLMNELKHAADCGVLDFRALKTTLTVHELGALLKAFLRDMPDPVIPPDAQQRFLAAMKIANPEEQLKVQAEAFNSLAPPNRALMRALLAFLATVAANSHVNSMNANNLAVVVAPNILRSTGSASVEEAKAINVCLGLMITRYWDFFEAPQAPLTVDPAPTEFITLRRKLLGHSNEIRVLSLTSNKKNMWSVDCAGGVHIWDTLFCSHVTSFVSEAKDPTAICLVGYHLWIGTLNGIYVYDSFTMALADKIPGIVALSLTWVATRNEVWCGSKGGITVYNGATRKGTAITTTGVDDDVAQTDFFAMCTTPSGKVWLGGFRRGAPEQFIHIWDLVKCKYERLHKIAARPKKLTSLVCVSDHTVWSSDEGSINAWDARTYERLGTMERHTGPIFGLAVLPDQVWSCSWDKTIKIWDSTSFHCVGEITGYHTDTVSVLTPCVDPASGLFNIWRSSDKAEHNSHVVEPGHPGSDHIPTAPKKNKDEGPGAQSNGEEKAAVSAESAGEHLRLVEDMELAQQPRELDQEKHKSPAGTGKPDAALDPVPTSPSPSGLSDSVDDTPGIRPASTSTSRTGPSLSATPESSASPFLPTTPPVVDEVVTSTPPPSPSPARSNKRPRVGSAAESPAQTEGVEPPWKQRAVGETPPPRSVSSETTVPETPVQSPQVSESPSTRAEGPEQEAGVATVAQPDATQGDESEFPYPVAVPVPSRVPPPVAFIEQLPESRSAMMETRNNNKRPRDDVLGQEDDSKEPDTKRRALARSADCSGSDVVTTSEHSRQTHEAPQDSEPKTSASDAHMSNPAETQPILGSCPPSYAMPPPPMAAYPAYPAVPVAPGLPGAYVVPQVPVVCPDFPSGQGFHYRDVPANVRCQYCNATVTTVTSFTPGLLTWGSAGVMCVFGLWLGCCCVPFCIDSMQDVEHRCPSCQRIVGMHYRIK